jgi:hypothetical protein
MFVRKNAGLICAKLTAGTVKAPFLISAYIELYCGSTASAIAAAFSEGLGFVHPARQVAAETDAPAMTERRVRKSILGPNRKWVSRISTL